jgi:hypothetical protein
MIIYKIKYLLISISLSAVALAKSGLFSPYYPFSPFTPSSYFTP